MSATKDKRTTAMRRPHLLYRPDARALNLLGDKWTPLILAELAKGPVRFVEIQRRLLTISTEALRTALARMVEHGLLTRTRYREVPPRVDYELTKKGRDALSVSKALYAFGLEHEWGNPRKGERQSKDALNRLEGIFS